MRDQSGPTPLVKHTRMASNKRVTRKRLVLEIWDGLAYTYEDAMVSSLIATFADVVIRVQYKNSYIPHGYGNGYAVLSVLSTQLV